MLYDTGFMALEVTTLGPMNPWGEIGFAIAFFVGVLFCVAVIYLVVRYIRRR